MTGVVLAGGRSSRMGTDKALVRVGGRRLIERVVETLRGLFPEVLIVANRAGRYEDLRGEVITDLLPGKAVLGGIYTGLKVASFPKAFFAACDMPFLNPALITSLKDKAEGADVVIPDAQGELHPLHAIYSKACLPFIEEEIRADRLKVTGFLSHVKVRIVPEEALRPFDPDLLSLFNANTPEDLALAERLANEWVDRQTANHR
ncbi:MAG: molybdenum cofactor guanylyltransferase [candidate division NC10 bacterium]|nr:molybdenum cofactor guanylyltransferase [candidate division NC10 bacterium]